MALASAMGRQIFSVYPNTASSVRILLHGVIEPMVISQVKSMPTVFRMCSRDGNLDATKGVWFHPNHFIPLLEVEGDTIKEEKFKDRVSTTKKRESRRPKIYEPLSNSESEQEVAEHDENAIFSQSEKEDELESF